MRIEVFFIGWFLRIAYRFFSQAVSKYWVISSWVPASIFAFFDIGGIILVQLSAVRDPGLFNPWHVLQFSAYSC